MKPPTDEVMEKLASVRLLAMDVDGVLTDGKIVYSSAGHELRAFHAADGLGIVVVQSIGVEVAWITGRTNAIVDRRAAELAVRWVQQGIQDKGEALRGLAVDLSIKLGDIAYIGDDWNDLPALHIAGVKIAPADAHGDVRSVADIVTERTGGCGAVREAIDAIIDAKGMRDTAHARYFEGLRRSSFPTSQ